MTLIDLLTEGLTAKEHFWFIETFKIKERTDETVALHFVISSDLFVQVFYSERVSSQYHGETCEVLVRYLAKLEA